MRAPPQPQKVKWPPCREDTFDLFIRWCFSWRRSQPTSQETKKTFLRQQMTLLDASRNKVLQRKSSCPARTCCILWMCSMATPPLRCLLRLQSPRTEDVASIKHTSCCCCSCCHQKAESIKFLSAKICPPPRKQDPKSGKNCTKSVENHPNWHFSGGG